MVLEKTRNKTKEDAEDIATKYLSLIHLSNQVNKLPKNVSGRQAQRASIAWALSVDPNIIFLDEPTASLDPIITNEVLTAVEELRDSGKELVFVTHVMSFVKDIADYVIYMHNGRILEHGLPNILESPKTNELKEFMRKVR